MCSIGAGNSTIQAAHLFKSANHSPSDSDEEPDSVKFPLESPSIEKSYEEETAATEYREVSIADPGTSKKRSKKSNKKSTKRETLGPALEPPPEPSSLDPPFEWLG
jgi:hypothetical protein